MISRKSDSTLMKRDEGVSFSALCSADEDLAPDCLTVRTIKAQLTGEPLRLNNIPRGHVTG